MMIPKICKNTNEARSVQLVYVREREPENAINTTAEHNTNR